jgi:N-hydroxyarylamine O-acetyltransferase
MPEVSPPALNLDAYCARIGYTGARTPTSATLTALHRAHVRAIPFEYLDIHLGRGIRIDLASIQQKLVRDRRGGYCFEQNTLFAAVLRALGFTVAPLVARVRWNQPADLQTPLTHMLLRVEVPGAGPCLADVGFGSMSLVEPIRFELDREQPGGLEPRRVVANGKIFTQQAKLGETWSDVYLFSTDEAPGIDFEVGNWYTSTHPQSRFRQHLGVSIAGENCRHTLLNRELSTRHADGRVEKRTIDSADELLAVLAEYFGLHFPPGTRFGDRADAPWPH